MTAKEYLLQIKNIHTKIENKKERIARLSAIVSSPGVPELKADVVQSSPKKDKTEMMIVEKTRLQDEVERLMYEEAVLIINIGRQIDRMKNPTYSRLLHLRYEEHMTFKEISERIGCKYKRTCNLHGEALNEFERVYLT